MKFLSAHWKHLLLANYIVEPEVLDEFVPAKTTLDTFDGQLFVSLVAFLFDRTSVLGVPAFFHRKFEEVNLRFYVKPDKDPSIRAVTFIKEIVPKSIIPLIANTFFHENYVKLPMDHSIDDKNIRYAWGKDNANQFSAKIQSELTYPEEGSIGEFITEHYWGYAKGPKATLEYQVEHPQWKCCEVEDYDVALDFADTYGDRFGFLCDQKPFNVLYAEGSAVTVSFPARI